MAKTPFTEDDRTLLTCIKSDYDYICEQFIQMKAQVQRMESHIQRQEEEFADQRRRGKAIEKFFAEFWEVKMDVIALRRGQESRRFTAERKEREEESASPTLEAPGRIQ